MIYLQILSFQGPSVRSLGICEYLYSTCRKICSICRLSIFYNENSIYNKLIPHGTSVTFDNQRTKNAVEQLCHILSYKLVIPLINLVIYCYILLYKLVTPLINLVIYCYILSYILVIPLINLVLYCNQLVQTLFTML